jgi:hypothetical protein
MERQIIFDQDEQEGLMYDLERANSEGLMEHATIRVRPFGRDESYEINVTDELLDALHNAMDLSVNQGPHTTSYQLTLVYGYDYGRVKEAV